MCGRYLCKSCVDLEEKLLSISRFNWQQKKFRLVLEKKKEVYGVLESPAQRKRR